MHAAGVVSDHAAQRASIVGRGIRSECQMMLFGGIAQTIENHAGLNPCDPPHGIDFKNLGHVLRKIEDHDDIAALSCEGSSTAAAEDGRAEFTSQRNSCDDVVGVAGKNYSDGNLAIVGSVGGVEGAGAVVEANVTVDMTAQSGGERTCIHHCRFGSAGELGEVVLHAGGRG